MLLDQFRHEYGDGEEVQLMEPYLLEQTHQVRFRRSNSFPGMLRKLVRQLLLRFYRKIKEKRKFGGYYVVDELLFISRKWSDTRKVSGPHMVKLSDLGNGSFFFYPLHTEPEISMSQLSPEYFFQMAAIAAISRDLPTGVMLVVKETVHGVGRRPVDFYKQISSFKNVILIDMLERGIDIVKKAKGTVTITGTAGFEAAVMGKPVISFGRHNNFNFLPHVYVVETHEKIREAVSSILHEDADREVRSKKDGLRYLRAVVKTSIDFGEYDYVNYAKYDPELPVDAVELLVAGLDFESRKFVNS